MTSAPAVEIRNLRKCYVVHHERRPSLKQRLVRAVRPRPVETFWVLDDISLSVGGGEAVGVIGHNGAGKSTLLRLIAGILRPSAGELIVNGKVGGLFELAAGFHPELNGLDNIMLTGTLMGHNTRAVRRQMERIIAFAEIEDFIDVPVKTYSSGMALRLGFAIATAFDPEVILVDEVLAVADERFQRKAYGELRRLRDEGSALFLVSHEMSAITELCERTVWLDGGGVRADGDTRFVADEYLAQYRDSDGG